MRYRYITSGGVRLSDPVRRYHLIGGAWLPYDTAECIRIEIPGDMRLYKDRTRNWSTAPTDWRLIRELHPVRLIKINNRFRPMSEAQAQLVEAEGEGVLLDHLLHKHWKLTDRGWIVPKGGDPNEA